MDRRTKLLILLGLIAILILFLFLLLWRPTQKATPTPKPTPVAEDTTPEETTPPEPTREERAEAERASVSSIRTLSETFAERYGSYSAEANFANLTDVLVLMTPSFAAETQAFIDTAEQPTDYYGVTTRVVSTKVLSQDEAAGTATVEVSTQREEAIGSAQNLTVSYETLTLELVYLEGSWLVDSAEWE